MIRTTITFQDETYKKIEDRTMQKGMNSIAHCIRNMVDICFKIEEAALKSDEDESDTDLLQAILELKTLLKSNLNWSLETRFLVRFLVENQPSGSKEKKIEILEKYKESAGLHVNELLNKNGNKKLSPDAE